LFRRWKSGKRLCRFPLWLHCRSRHACREYYQNGPIVASPPGLAPRALELQSNVFLPSAFRSTSRIPRARRSELAKNCSCIEVRGSLQLSVHAQHYTPSAVICRARFSAGLPRPLSMPMGAAAPQVLNPSVLNHKTYNFWYTSQMTIAQMQNTTAFPAML